MNLLYWQVTCEAFNTPKEWQWWFDKAKYNGVPIGSYNGAPFNSNSNNTATMINSYNGFNGYWGNSQTGEGTHNTIMKKLAENNCWWMIIDEDIQKQNTLTNVENQYLGEYIDDNCNITVKKGTFIPCALSSLSLIHI